MKSVKEGLKLKKKLTIFFSIALILLTILAVVAKIETEEFINDQAVFSKVISLAGKQRMLSQRIMLLVQSLSLQKMNDGYNVMKAELITSTQLMSKLNENLANGNISENFPKISNSEIERMYFGKGNLYQKVIDFTQFAKSSAVKNDFNDFLIEYNIYKVNSLLIDLEKIVTLYSNESDLQVKKLIGISYVILFSTLLLLLLEYFAIFKPIANYVSNKLNKAEDNILSIKNEKHILEIESRSAHRALGNIVPRVEFINNFNTEKVKLASYYQCASDKGGDWWGIYEFDKTKIILIGDVSGHEAGSSIIAAAVSGYFEELSSEKNLDKHDFLHIFKHLNEFIEKIGTNNKMTMSMSVLIFNENLDRVKFINAAQTFPFIINYKENGESKITRFKSKGHPLGFKKANVLQSEEEEEIKITEYEFKEDSLICFFSNGLTANTDKENKNFGEKNLKKFFEKNNFKNTELLTVVEKLIDEAYSFYEDEPINDDITFILIKHS